jgi:hypothetical protein
LNDQQLFIRPSWSIFGKLVPPVSCALADTECVVPYSGSVAVNRGFDFFIRGGDVYRVVLFADRRQRLGDELARRGIEVGPPR